MNRSQEGRPVARVLLQNVTKKYGGDADLEIEKADELLAEERNGTPPSKNGE